MTTNDTLIKVEHLVKSFGDIDVLKGIDTEIKHGEVVVIIGASGSGKSTFLRCLNRLEESTDGQMGMVFQQFNLFPHMTVLKNMISAPMKLLKMSRVDAEAKAMALLEKVGLADRAGAYPAQLSGGQKQRIAIVRALCMDPEVMLFDEPTKTLPKKV